MFSRQLIAAAVLMAATCAANADVITTTTTVSSDMSIVDTATALTGANTGLAAILASSDTSLVRGVEGLYMLARTNAPLASSGETTTTTTPPAAAASDASDIIAIAPAANAITPVVNAAVVPEPATLALMFAGLLGVVSLTRARKQG